MGMFGKLKKGLSNLRDRGANSDKESVRQNTVASFISNSVSSSIRFVSDKFKGFGASTLDFIDEKIGNTKVGQTISSIREQLRPQLLVDGVTDSPLLKDKDKDDYQVSMRSADAALVDTDEFNSLGGRKNGNEKKLLEKTGGKLEALGSFVKSKRAGHLTHHGINGLDRSSIYESRTYRWPDVPLSLYEISKIVKSQGFEFQEPERIKGEGRKVYAKRLNESPESFIGVPTLELTSEQLDIKSVEKTKRSKLEKKEIQNILDDIYLISILPNSYEILELGLLDKMLDRVKELLDLDLISFKKNTEKIEIETLSENYEFNFNPLTKEFRERTMSFLRGEKDENGRSILTVATVDRLDDILKFLYPAGVNFDKGTGVLSDKWGREFKVVVLKEKQDVLLELASLLNCDLTKSRMVELDDIYNLPNVLSDLINSGFKLNFDDKSKRLVVAHDKLSLSFYIDLKKTPFNDESQYESFADFYRVMLDTDFEIKRRINKTNATVLNLTHPKIEGELNISLVKPLGMDSLSDRSLSLQALLDFSNLFDLKNNKVNKRISTNEILSKLKNIHRNLKYNHQYSNLRDITEQNIRINELKDQFILSFMFKDGSREFFVFDKASESLDINNEIDLNNEDLDVLHKQLVPETTDPSLIPALRIALEGVDGIESIRNGEFIVTNVASLLNIQLALKLVGLVFVQTNNHKSKIAIKGVIMPISEYEDTEENLITDKFTKTLLPLFDKMIDDWDNKPLLSTRNKENCQLRTHVSKDILDENIIMSLWQLKQKMSIEESPDDILKTIYEDNRNFYLVLNIPGVKIQKTLTFRKANREKGKNALWSRKDNKNKTNWASDGNWSSDDASWINEERLAA